MNRDKKLNTNVEESKTRCVWKDQGLLPDRLPTKLTRVKVKTRNNGKINVLFLFVRLQLFIVVQKKQIVENQIQRNGKRPTTRNDSLIFTKLKYFEMFHVCEIRAASYKLS